VILGQVVQPKRPRIKVEVKPVRSRNTPSPVKNMNIFSGDGCGRRGGGLWTSLPPMRAPGSTSASRRLK
jgi:hypothetical protein